ncbi:RHH-type rel operon transcriptional repressor/antitoxin RelB [Paraburkholderia youngii]|uniref:hypothetical protein n=1 Tax=Paraburkholderia youngii TaxID=2782701 RepID=UPI003D1DBD77
MKWNIREHMLGRRKSAEKLKVVAVRIDPVIERRIRFLSETTGRKQSYFLQQLIEGGISALEEAWSSPALLMQVRAGTAPEPTVSRAAPDLFAETAFVD